MTPWLLVISPAAARDLDKLANREWDAVSAALERLIADTGRADIRKLAGRGDEWRLRVGRWRVRFRFDQPTHSIEIQRVLPRGRAYRDS